MVSKKSLVDLVTRLMAHLANAEKAFADALVERILLVCSVNNYENVTNFKW